MGFIRNLTGKSMIGAAAALTAISLVKSAYAGKNVEVDRVVKGSATFSDNGSVLTIHAGDHSIINYHRFDVANGETVRFIQPTAHSSVLNRINSAAPSRINGAISGNGIVYFVNPAGVMFGANAVINVGRFYAAAGNITDKNFLNNVNQFRATGAIVNQGVINADAVALIGRSVSNAGTISAEGGLVTMVAGDDVLLGTRDGHIMVKLGSTSSAAGDQPAGSVTNTGTVQASSTMLAAGDLYSLAIGGNIKSKQVTAQAGGDVAVTGRIDASDSSANSTGGSVVITGKDVALTGASIDASGSAGGGSVLIGGDFHGQGPTPTATNTIIDSASTLTANATIAGNGGKVVVWSNSLTTYNGSIYAKGGSSSGNGGQVEVSGKQNLAFNGQVDVTAPAGNVGTLLLDPANITIQASNPDVHGDGSNQDITGDIASSDDPGKDSVITSGALVTLLNTADVSLAASNDINVNDVVDASGNAGSHGLTMTADHDVNVNFNIDLNNADLHLSAGNHVSLTGALNTHGGDVFIESTGDIQGAGLITAHNLTLGALTGIGNVTTLATSVSAIEADSADNGIFIGNTSGAALDLGFVGGTKSGVHAGGTGNIDISNDSDIHVQTTDHPVVADGGDVTLSATAGQLVVDNFNIAGVAAAQVAASGQVALTASGDILLGSAAKGDVHAGNGLTIHSTGGSIILDGGTFVATDAGDASITALTAITLAQSVAPSSYIHNDGSGTLTVSAPSFTADSGATFALQSGGTLTIAADTVTINDTIGSSSAGVIIKPLTAGRAISLANGPVGGTLTLTDPDLDLVSVGTGQALQIGDTASGNISLSGSFDNPAGWNMLHLITSGTLSDAGGGTLAVPNLAIDAPDGVIMNNQTHSVDTLAVNSAGDVSFQNFGSVQIGIVDGVTGITSSGSTLLLSSGGAITQNSAIAGSALTAANIGLTASTGIGDAMQFISTATSNLEAGTDTGGVFIQNTGAISIGNVTASLSGIQVTTSGGITLSATGTISVTTLGEVISAPGDITLNATGMTSDVITDGANGNGDPAAISSSAGSVRVMAGRDASIGLTNFGDVTAATGLEIDAGRDLTIDNSSAVSTSGGDVILTATNSVQILGNGGGQAIVSNSGSGQILITAPTFVSSSGGAPDSVSTVSGGIVIITDDFTLSGGLINAGTGAVTIQPQTTGLSIAFANGPVMGSLTLTDPEMTDLAGSAIIIGNASAGAISVSSAITQPAGWDTLHLITGANVSDAAGGTLQADHLAVSSATGIDLSHQTQSISTFAGSVSGTGDIALVTSSPLTIDTVTGVTGASVITGNITLTADAMTFSQAVSAPTGIVTLKNLTPAVAINLGGADSAGILGLDQSDLNQITATVLRIGTTTAGAITVGTVSDASAGWHVIHLITGSSVTETDGFYLTNGSLAIEAAGPVNLPGPNEVDTFAASTSSTLAFRSANNLTIGIVDGVTGLTTSGLTQLNSDMAITLTQNVSAGTGNLLAISGQNGVTQSAGSISAGSLAVYAPNGNIDLHIATNNVDNFAATASGTITYTDANSFTLTNVNGVIGATSSGNVLLTATAGDLTVDQPISTIGSASAGNVTLTASGAISVSAPITATGADSNSGAAGNGGTVTITGASVSVASIDSSGGSDSSADAHGGNAGQITLTSSTGNITLNNNLTAAGGAGDVPAHNGADADIALHGPVVLASSLTLTGANIGFLSTLNGTTAGGQALTLVNSNTASFSGNVGATMSLASLSVSGTADIISGGSIITTGDQTYTGAFGTAVNATLTGNNLTFNSTVRGLIDASATLTLNNTGTATFNGAVGDNDQRPLSLTVAGPAVINGQTVTTSGDQTYSSTVTLGADTTLTGGSFTFNSTIAATTDGGQGLTIINSDLDNPDVTTPGLATFNAPLGVTTPKLSFLTVNSPAALNNDQIITAGAQTYSNDTTLGADTTLTGTDITFSAGLDGAHTLQINNTGLATFGGAVGSTTPLTSLTVAGAAALNGSVITTSGNQSYNSTVTVGGNETLTGVDLTFASTIDDSTDGGHNLNLVNSGQAILAAPVGSIHPLGSLSVSGNLALNGGYVSTVGGQTYSGPVTLSQNTVLNAGGNVTFQNSVNGNVTLDVNTANAVARFEASSSLISLATSGKTFFGTHGVATNFLFLTTDASTAAHLSVGGNLTVAGNVKLQLVTDSAKGIRFGGDINGQTIGQDDLTVQVPWHLRTDSASDAIQLPLIVFASQNIGTRTELRSLRLNAAQSPDLTSLSVDTDPTGGANASATPPAVATIYAPKGFNVKVAHDFTMGKNEKLTVGKGSISIHAGSVATVGDLNAPGDITVTAPTILLQNRPAGPVYIKATGQTQQDSGLDFVAGGIIRFNGHIRETNPSYLVSFSYGGATDPGISRGQIKHVVVRQLSTPITEGALLADLTIDGSSVTIPLDLAASGYSIANPATTIAGATHLILPQPGDESGISAAQQALLAEIGINARDLTNLEMIDSLNGRDFYIQSPDSSEIAVGRLYGPAVADVLKTYSDYFIEEQPGPDGQTSTVDTRAHMHEVLTKALDALNAANPGAEFDPVAYRRFVESHVEQHGAADALNKLKTLLTRVEALGLTPHEMNQVRAELFKRIKPDAMPMKAFVKAVMG